MSIQFIGTKEEEQVVAASTEVIARVMLAGAKNHKPGSWKKQSANEHFLHAFIHLHNVHLYGLGCLDEDTGLKEIEHALCRLGMAAAIQAQDASHAKR